MPIPPLKPWKNGKPMALRSISRHCDRAQRETQQCAANSTQSLPGDGTGNPIGIFSCAEAAVNKLNPSPAHDLAKSNGASAAPSNGLVWDKCIHEIFSQLLMQFESSEHLPRSGFPFSPWL